MGYQAIVTESHWFHNILIQCWGLIYLRQFFVINQTSSYNINTTKIIIYIFSTKCTYKMIAKISHK